MTVRHCVSSFSIRVAAILAIALAGVASSATAAPWQMITLKKVDADPNKTYTLTESQGPWMIMVNTFHGPDAAKRAHELVLELRKSYKLNAFESKKTFDYTQRDLPGNHIDAFGRPKKMKNLHDSQQPYDDYAVLVGDYRGVDDPDAKKTLAMIKSAEPDCMRAADGKPVESQFAKMRRQAEEMFTGVQLQPKGPLAGAFMTTNPLLPPDYFTSKGIDKFVVDLNKGVKYSLLDCRGRYTVKIATFTGHVEINQRKISDLERSGKMDVENGEDPLHIAGAKAHALTEELRKQGIEAYEFHDRYSSIVTIGSFNSVGSPRQDGKTEINPAVYEIMKKYGPDPATVAAKQASGEQLGAKTITVTIDGKRKPVMLDVQPLPVEVPQRSIGADYQQTTMLR